MTPEQYRDRVRAALDATRTHEKEQIILEFIKLLFGEGDPEHEVQGSEFIAAAAQLLAAFHPDELAFPDEKKEVQHADSTEVEF